MSKTEALSIENLHKTYRPKNKNGTQKEALKGINLTVPQGAFFGLLGPNGAGKSTLINILAGLTVKTSGTASICGYDIDTQTRAARASIGVVPQELILDPFFTPREALEFHAGYYGVPKKQRRTMEILEALGLADKADVGARALSGGMRRRLLIGKALVHNPKVLVLDEPTAGVDVELRHQLWDYVVKLNKSGTTILLTTHYLEEAEELCDHIAIINHGNIIANDSKSKLLRLLDHKQLVIQTNEPLQEIPAGLEAFDTKRTEEGQLLVSYHSSKTSIDAILQHVTKAGYSLKDLSTKEPDLEAIFRHLMQQAA